MQSGNSLFCPSAIRGVM
uniref:Uncharacterized protein n=1 Tax=Anguilla anguilla TaxID=7936 RepID=A0A0E9TA91_ANGAN